MTSIVTVSAHCSPDKHVLVERYDGNNIEPATIIENGESKTFHIYDNWTVKAAEVEKQKAAPPDHPAHFSGSTLS